MADGPAKAHGAKPSYHQSLSKNLKLILFLQAITLMNKYNAVLRERQVLREEIDFLKSQLPGFRKSDRISISDLESTDKPM